MAGLVFTFLESRYIFSFVFSTSVCHSPGYGPYFLSLNCIHKLLQWVSLLLQSWESNISQHYETSGISYFAYFCRVSTYTFAIYTLANDMLLTTVKFSILLTSANFSFTKSLFTNSTRFNSFFPSLKRL